MARRSQDRSSTSADRDEYQGDPVPVIAQPHESATPDDVTMNGRAQTGDQRHGLVALEEETRRRLEAESTLRDSEARYRLLYDNNPSMYFTLSPNGMVVSVNRFGATQLGYQPEELIGQSVLKVFKPDEHQAVLGQLTVCAASPMKVFQWEIQKVRKDGSTLWVRERAQAVVDHTGQILALVVCEDITERRLTEDCMRESEERWRALFEHAGVGIAQLGLNGHFLRVNPRLCETLGYSSKTMMRHTMQDFFHPGERQVNLEHLDQLVAGKRPSFSTEARYRRCDDAWLWVEMTVSLVRDANSAPAYLIAVVQNIDDRKQAESRLARTTELLQTLVRESPLPIVSLDLGARVTSWNQAATRLFGWSEEEVLGRELPYVPEEEAEAADLLWKRGLRGEIHGPIELRRSRKDGKMLDLLLWPVFVQSDRGEVSTAIGLFVDQSDLKRAEEALQVSESAIRELYEITSRKAAPFDQQIRELLDLGRRRFQLPIAAFTTFKGGHLELTALRSDRPIADEGSLLSLSNIFDHTLTMTGSVAIEHVDKSVWKDGLAWPLLQCQAYLGTGLSVGGQRFGTICFMDYAPYPGQFAEADKDFLLLMARWITRELERQNSERALQEQEALLRSVIETATDAIFMKDREGRYRFINTAGALVIGRSCEEIVGKTDVELLPSETAERLMTEDQHVLSEGVQKRHFETLFPGEARAQTFYTVKTPHTDQLGNIVGLVGIARDMTELKRAETELRNSEERFRLMFENAPVGMVIVSPEKTLRKINPAFQRLVGYSEEEIVGHTYAFYTHPDDLPQNLLVTDQFLRGEIPGYALEKRYVRKDGEVIWVNVNVSPLRLPGEPDRLLLAIVEDITDRKRAESALALTQFAVNHAGDLIFWIGRDARILYVNEAAAQRLGYSREELCHMTIGDIDPNYQPDVWPRHWAELRLHKKLRFESCYRTRAGDLYPAEIVSTYVNFEGQEYNFAFTRDISERKAAEEALRASEERFSKAFRSSPYPIGITDLDTGACLDINDAALAVFGFTREEVIGQTTFTLGIWPKAGARRQFIEHVKKNGSVRNVEVPLKSKRGDVRRFLTSTEVIELNGKQCLVTIGTDITEQKRAEEALRRSELAVRQAFEERDRLSQDLHDNLLQSLYAVGMGLELTKQRIQRTSRTNAKRLEQSVAQLNQVIREVRSFISQTQAPVVFEQTVADALRALAGSFMATGAGEIAVRIDDEDSMRLSQEQRTHILAITKEALSNSIRHTKADKRVVTLRRHGNKIRLEITDNGQGFSPAHRRAQGMGLQNMRARARKLRGRIAITSVLQKGTTVALTIPSA